MCGELNSVVWWDAKWRVIRTLLMQWTTFILEVRNRFLSRAQTHTNKAAINSVILRYEDLSTVYLLPNFRENVVASASIKILLVHCYHWRWVHYFVSKRRESIIQRRGVIPRRTESSATYIPTRKRNNTGNVRAQEQQLLWENNKCCIFWACVCSLRYPACKAHEPHYILICGLSGSTILFHIILKTARCLEKCYWT
jgi:hypothetical protein